MKNKKQKINKIWLIIIALSIFTITLFFFYKNQNLNNLFSANILNLNNEILKPQSQIKTYLNINP